MNKCVLGFIALVFAITVILIVSYDDAPKQEKTRIGVVMPGMVNEPGWNGVHYRGIKEASDELGAVVVLVENVPEYSGLCAKAVDSLIQLGIKAIILGSYNYPDEIAEVIKAHPDVVFFGCSSTFTGDNYKTYFARVYQARYLSGIIAGLHTKGNVGYVAAMKNTEVYRGLDAFALGVLKSNPQATINVIWTGSWDDSAAERNNMKTLVSERNIDVVAYHQNQTNVIDAAEAAGILSIGYNLGQPVASPNLLTSVATDWKIVYKSFIQDFLQKRENISSYWIGIEKDAVMLSFYSSLVTEEDQEAVRKTIEEIKNGVDVFAGPIWDNQGNKRCNSGEVIGDVELRNHLDWYVKGIKVYEK